MTNVDNEVRLQGDIASLTQAVLLVQNEITFLRGRAEQGTVTPDDLTGLETALSTLATLHPDVQSAVENPNPNTGAGTVGTDQTAVPTPPSSESEGNVSSEAPTNTGTTAQADESGSSDANGSVSPDQSAASENPSGESPAAPTE